MNFPGQFDPKLSYDSPVSLDGERFSFDSKPGFVQNREGSSAIIVPDAHLLFSGEYMRIGNDLIISGTEQKFVVGNYFKGENRPALSTKDGATLSGHIVDALTGHVHYAQAAAPGVGQTIGNVLKLSGSASAIRNGVSIELHIGDAIQKGDVIQTGSNSSIGMTLVDGSAFGMSSNARMVLNEMVFDPNGSSNSSLMSLVQGTITFVAGQTAKNGNMRVETPVATMGIRGTAVLVEIAADDGPTKFSVLVEPDGKTGSYNLYDKTTGQLIGTVSQAGQVTFVSVGGIGQPATAVEQLKTLADQQAAKTLIQDVFKLYFPNYNPDDSNPNSKRGQFGSPRDNINPFAYYTSPQDARPPSQNVIHVPWTDPVTGVVQDRVFYNVLAKFSTLAVAASQSIVTPGQVPVSIIETFKLGDKVVIDDPDIGNAPFFDIATPFVAGSAIITTATSTVGAVSESFLKSLLTIDQTTGDVSFDRLDFNFLDDGQTATFMIEVLSKSGPDSKKVLIPVTVTGANDEPTIVVGAGTVVAGGVTEDSVALTAALEADGVITFRDADLTDAHTATVALTSTASTLPGFVANTELGTFTIDTVVTEFTTDTLNTGTLGWHFTLPDNDPVLQSLAVGQTITQIYTITIMDDNNVPVTQAVTITITGTNDVPTIVAGEVSQAATIYEIPGQTGGTQYDETADGHVPSGTIHFADIDLIDRPAASTSAQAITYLSSDGISDLSGTLTSGQRSAIEDAFKLSVPTGPGANTNNGVVNWTYELVDNVLDFLAEGETITLVSIVQISDGNGGLVEATVTINIVGGANDVPSISSVSGLALTELTTPLQDTITVDFIDVDLTQTGHTSSVQNVAITGVVPPGTTDGQIFTSALPGAFFGLLVAGVVTKASGADHGSASFDFNAGPGVFDYLAAGEIVTLTYTVAVTDSLGATGTHTASVTITGTNDAPVMTADTSGTGGTNVHDLPEANSGLTTSGTLLVTDVDVANTVAASVLDVTVGGTGASALPSVLDNAALKAMFSVDSGNVIDNTHTTGTINWGFNSGAEAFNFLADGETLVLTYTVRATDSDTTHATADQTVIVTITGTNDIPVFGGDIAKAVTEDADLTGTDLVTSGILTIADADHDQSSFAATPVGGAAGSNGYGTFTLDSSGNWTYIADNNQAVVQQLAVGQSLTDTYEAVSADGTHQTITVTINGTNDAPTVAAALTLSTTEGNAPVVRDLLAGALDIDNGETATLTVENISYLVDGLPANMPVGVTIFPDAGTIKINVDAANPAFDHIAAGETQTIIVSYDVTDAHLATVAQTETITITGVNDQPVLATGVDLSTITENETANSGQLVSSFATGISDADDDAVQGVAITGYTNQNGHWEYSINNGTNWTQFGLYSTAAGLLLSSDDKVRFVPDALNGGTDTLTYVAWDQTTGTHGQTANTPSGLQSDAFSQGSQTATLSVTDVNDAAVIGDPSMAEVREGDSAGNLVASGTLSISDVDSPEFFNPAVTDATGYTNLGTLSLQTDGQYAYSVANSNASVQALSGTQTHVDVFTIQSQDGTTKDVSFTINGVTEIASTSVANEALFATIGRDNFVFTSAFGDDTVTGFDFGGNDIIQFDTSMFASLQDILDQTADVSGNAVITASANDTVTLIGVTKAQLQQTDFHLV